MDVFSSIWTGVGILTFLFIYSSIGSAGYRVRQLPVFEMTEFEWFHWWPMNLAIALLCAGILVTTWRRIPWRRDKAGVWMAHLGILILCLGSWLYFRDKIEGDTPVARRQIRIEIPNAPALSLVALPGSSATFGEGDRRYEFEVAEIRPDWPVLSEQEKGATAYSVSVQVKTPEQQFIRQLLAGYPQYTEDVIPGQGRAIKSTGKRLVDETLKLSLDYEPQDCFYLKDSRALYLRLEGDREWVERPIHGLPRYNDYVASRSDAWPASSNTPIEPRPIDLAIHASRSDADLGAVEARVTGYLRYATLQSRPVPGGDSLNPVATVRLESPEGAAESFQLAALHPEFSSTEKGEIAFRWIASDDEIASLTATAPRRLRIEIPGATVAIDDPIASTSSANPQLGFASIPGSPYSYRVRFTSDWMTLGDGRQVSVAVVDVKAPGKEFTRWVADDPASTRDMAPGGSADKSHQSIPLDAGIRMAYTPGQAAPRILLVAGPGIEGVQAVTRDASGEVARRPLALNQATSVEPGLSLRLTEYIPNASLEARPAITPVAQRNSDAGEFYSMIEVEIASGGQVISKWLPYHQYPVPGPEYRYLSSRYEPIHFHLPDGRAVEAMFSRERRRLPNPVALEDFVLTTHVGGYSGDVASVRDWTSQVRFRDGDVWGDLMSVSTNAPVESGGLWFFQASWDRPQPPSGTDDPGIAGLNYTGLGVGNRHGVHVQLIGCIVAVLGMIYSFYGKPLLRRQGVGAAAPLLPSAHGDELYRLGRPKVTEQNLAPVGAASARRLRISLSALAGALAGLLLVYLALRASADSGAAPSTDFASRVDLSPLSRIAVHTDGRLKSFDSFANSMMRNVSGPRLIAGHTPGFTYLDMMLRPEAYADADIIYVKNALLREQISRILKDRPETPAARLASFKKSGLISPQLLSDPEVRQLLAVLGADLVRYSKFVDMVDSALSIRSPAFLADRLRLVPPPKGNFQTPWLSVESVAHATAPTDAAHAGGDAAADGLDAQTRAAIGGHWDTLISAWRGQDVAKANASILGLAGILPGVEPSLYPSQKRLAWESWYFAHSNMTWTWFVYVFSVIFLLMAVVYKWTAARRLGLGLFLAAFALHTFALGLRWYVSGRWPNSNMFEAVTTSAWFGGCAALLLEFLGRRSAMRNLFALGSACASMAALMACRFLPAQLNPNIGNMMPVLHDIWLYIHTNVVIFSYCLIAMAAISASLYLLWRMVGGGPDYARVGGAGSLMLAGGPSSRVSAGQVFDGATMILIELSFVMLWSGIVMGAIWADHSWGRPWGWDPKEVFALNTFIIFVLLIHVRLKVRDKGLWTSVLALTGCGVMLFNWIVINFVISGLHSYA